MPPELHEDRARLYLSFADEDRPRAMELVRWLNDSGWRVAADDRHAFAAGTWSPSRRLDTCDVILCVITPGWLVSKFCHHEYAYCAKRGKFVLPVICEPFDLALLPPAIRALPRVDLTQNRMIDYLALKEVLTQAGSQLARSAAPSNTGAPRSFLRALRDRLWR
jgi:TIR domain